MKDQITTQKQAQSGIPKPTPQAGAEELLETMKHEEEEERTRELAKKYHLPYISLAGYPITPHVISIIPEDTARKFQAVAYLRVKMSIRVAVVDPSNPELAKFLSELSKATGYVFEMSVTSLTSLHYAWMQYSLAPAKDERAQEMEPEAKGGVTLAELVEKINAASVTDAVDMMFSAALALSASDIHLEPTEKDVRLRFRIDGVLQDVAVIAKDKQSAFTSRIKFLSKLKLDLKDLPQDGRFSVKVDKTDVDVRVSTLPELYGESIVMRLLVRGAERLGFPDLGFEGVTRERIDETLARPHGMILNTGPTGSGKTTTLYAMLEKLNKPGVKIMTLEDPIEYRLEGIVQSQVEVEKGYDFANGLRSILRQDPDVIMVGEIRDPETAKIAVNAAITGHIVLSTLHTTDSASAMPRILDMGVEPFLLSGAISLIIAQRLVRKICPYCKEERALDPATKAQILELWNTLPASYKSEFPKGVPEKMVYGKGCDVCRQTGFLGRIAIAEALEVTPAIEELVINKAPISALRKKSIEEGLVTIEQDGLIKVLKGITTIEEVWRVTRES